MILENYQPFIGQHCETTATGSLLNQIGIALSEPMLFGIGERLSFIYWNMNYHVEHHMFPIVPYHQLPALHEKIKHDLPAANPSIWHALKETYPVLIRQESNPDLFMIRELPETARRYQK